MKKLLLINLVLAVGACSSPNDERAWDFIPWFVSIDVHNANGDNLLDPDFENNILDNNIHIDYGGEAYPVNERIDEYYTRAIKPHWYGLVLDSHPGYGSGKLLFGEFGTTNAPGGYHGETFSIHWGDGTSDRVSFDLYITWQGRGNKRVPTVHKKLWLNGELQSDNSLLVEIVK